MTLWTSLILGFTLGMQHALDADHVVAISTILSQYRHPFKAALVGIFWGIGHTLTLFLVGMAVIVFKLPIPNQLALAMEFIVGVMLFVLGVQILWKYRQKRIHSHPHDHDVEPLVHEHYHFHDSDSGHSHPHFSHHHKSLLVGMIHGLAGSGALMLLLLGTLRSPVEGAAYILIFGLGSILGMTLISTAIGLPFALSAGRFASLNRSIRLVSGVASMILGILVMTEVGFVKGLIF